MLLLCLVFILLSCTATYAWFSMNQKVEEDTIGLSAKVTPNLVISTSASAISSLKADDAGVTEVTAVAAAEAFTPATHYGKNPAGATYALSGLHCPASYNNVNYYSGLSSGTNLIPIPSDGKRYYVEYTVYIAATDIAITNSRLTVSLGGIDGYDTSDLSWQAASVDFYLGSTAETNFKGTLNLAGLDAMANDGTTAKTSLEISLPSNRIPCNSDGYLTLIMRCYFDGALIFIEGEDTPRCYVNSQTVSTDEVEFNILISDTPIS